MIRHHDLASLEVWEDCLPQLIGPPEAGEVGEPGLARWMVDWVGLVVVVQDDDLQVFHADAAAVESQILADDSLPGLPVLWIADIDAQNHVADEMMVVAMDSSIEALEGAIVVNQEGVATKVKGATFEIRLAASRQDSDGVSVLVLTIATLTRLMRLVVFPMPIVGRIGHGISSLEDLVVHVWFVAQSILNVTNATIGFTNAVDVNHIAAASQLPDVVLQFPRKFEQQTGSLLVASKAVAV